MKGCLNLWRRKEKDVVIAKHILMVVRRWIEGMVLRSEEVNRNDAGQIVEKVDGLSVMNGSAKGRNSSVSTWRDSTTIMV